MISSKVDGSLVCIYSWKRLRGSGHTALGPKYGGAHSRYTFDGVNSATQQNTHLPEEPREGDRPNMHLNIGTRVVC